VELSARGLAKGMLVVSKGGGSMVRMDTGICLLAVACLLLIGVSAHANPDCWANGTAQLATETGFEGYWKYCYDVSWVELPNGVSHLDVFLLLDDCVTVCDPGYFTFADTVGTGPGCNDEPCTVYYYGLFECNGDPSIGVNTPLVKFEPYGDGHCEPDKAGTAYLCFYSMAPPVQAGSFSDVIAIKFGPNSDTGDLSGVLPSCVTTGTDDASWSQVKALYR
jgi:hypothetical protein